MVVVRRISWPGVVDCAGEGARRPLLLGEGDRAGEGASIFIDKPRDTADWTGIGEGP